MRNNVRSSPDDIDPLEIFAAIKRSLVKLLVLSLLVGLATYLVLSQMKPKFKSVAQLQFGGRAVVNPVGGSRQQSGRQGDVLQRVDKEAVASQVAVIKSRDLAIKLIKELKLLSNPEFNPKLAGGGLLGILGGRGSSGGVSVTDEVLLNYDRALKVFRGRDTRVISIQFSSSDAKLAARAANRLAELYLASRASQSVKQSFDAGAYLKPEIAKLKKQVQEAENRAETYRGTHNLFVAGSGAQRGTLNNAQLTDLTRALTRAQTQKAEAEARARTIRQLMRNGSADASPDVLRSPLIQQLKTQRVRVQRQLSELSATLLPAHPRMRQMRADLAGLNRQISAEIRKIADSLARGVNVAALRVKSIQASIDAMKSQVRDSSGNVAQLAELERGAKAKRQQLESLQARYQRALARQQTSAIPLEAELFSRARASTIPTLKKGPITALAMAGTFLLGLAFVITRELLAGSHSGGGSPNRGRRASDRHPQVHDKRQHPLDTGALIAEPYGLGVRTAASSSHGAARSEMAELSAGSIAIDRAAGAFAGSASGAGSGSGSGSGAEAPLKLQVEASQRFASYTDIGAVVRHIAGQRNAEGGLRSMIAAETSGGDAADVAIEVASHLAVGRARVILVDWSPTSKGLAPRLQLPARPGISELLRGDANFDDVIKCLPGSDVHFIAGGKNPAGSAAIFDADRLNLLLDALDEAYDHIIVHGSHKDASALFEAIQGRFDIGLGVLDGRRRVSVLDDAGRTFLGFEVSGLDIIRYHRQVGAAVTGKNVAGGQAQAGAKSAAGGAGGAMDQLRV